MANWDKLNEIKLREAEFKEARDQVNKATTFDAYMLALSQLSIRKIKLDAATYRLKSSYITKKHFNSDNFGEVL